MNAETISVVIPTHNRAHLIGRAVASAFAQDWPELEIIVVDDGSEDNTYEALCPWLEKGLIYERQKHRGVSAARNRGIALAKRKWIALLDSDDEWLPGKLAKQMKFFLDNPEYSICQCEEIWIRGGKRVNPMKKHKKYGGWIFERCLPLCVVSPSAVIIERELLQRVGGFDEELPACEDYDLWLRIASKYPIGLISEALLVRYGGRPDQLSYTEKQLDRYRIRALEKVLLGGALCEEYYLAALDELKTKCTIYGHGCLKRGKIKEGEYYLALPERFESNSN